MWHLSSTIKSASKKSSQNFWRFCYSDIQTWQRQTRNFVVKRRKNWTVFFLENKKTKTKRSFVKTNIIVLLFDLVTLNQIYKKKVNASFETSTGMQTIPMPYQYASMLLLKYSGKINFGMLLWFNVSFSLLFLWNAWLSFAYKYKLNNSK